MRLMIEIWFLNLTLLTLLVCAVAGLQIVVQFDGSLRPPNDYGMPTSTLGRMAACACTITNNVDDNYGPKCPLLLYGKGLITSSTMTSGVVEYEGLLFALKTLHTYLSFQDSSIIASIESITVLGDCKTVIDQIIDQMNGKSISRKLDHYYQRAVTEVESVTNVLFNIVPWGEIQFQHIPRSKNLICDGISACIILDQEKKALNDLCLGLLDFEKFTNRSTTGSNITKYLDAWFQHERSLIPLSKRATLYRYMAEVAIAIEDYHGLMEIGSKYDNDVGMLERNRLKANNRQDSVTSTSSSAHINGGIAKTEAITYQILSLSALGRSKEAARLQQKHRFILNQYASTVFEIESYLSMAYELPNKATKLLLQNEINNVDCKLQDQISIWPVPVQQWHHEATQSRRWDDDREWIYNQ